MGDVGRRRAIGGGTASSSLDEGEAGCFRDTGEEAVDGRPAERRQKWKKLDGQLCRYLQNVTKHTLDLHDHALDPPLYLCLAVQSI